LVGPIISNDVYFYKLTKNYFILNTLSDLKKLEHIGVGRGNASETLLIKEGFTNLYTVNNERNAILMLASGRVDVVPIGEMVINEMIKQADIDKTIIEKTNIKLTESVLYIGFSKNISDNEIKKWQEIFDIVKKEIYEDLYTKYINH
jgi:polar amino acid transport system substrate-binding protein